MTQDFYLQKLVKKQKLSRYSFTPTPMYEDIGNNGDNGGYNKTIVVTCAVVIALGILIWFAFIAPQKGVERTPAKPANPGQIQSGEKPAKTSNKGTAQFSVKL